MEDARDVMQRLSEALTRQAPPRDVARCAEALFRLVEAERERWSPDAVRQADHLLDRAGQVLGWCVGYRMECPEVRGLLDRVAREDCRVSLGGAVVHIVARQGGPSRVAADAGGRLHVHALDHPDEVRWMVEQRWARSKQS